MLDRFKAKIKKELGDLKDAILVSKAEAKRRISICEQCPSEKFTYLSRRCKDCGCFMDVKTKLKKIPGDPLKEEINCERGHWDKNQKS